MPVQRLVEHIRKSGEIYPGALEDAKAVEDLEAFANDAVAELGEMQQRVLELEEVTKLSVSQLQNEATETVKRLVD